jgi:hypothetical protein
MTALATRVGLENSGSVFRLPKPYECLRCWRSGFAAGMRARLARLGLPHIRPEATKTRCGRRYPHDRPYLGKLAHAGNLFGEYSMQFRIDRMRIDHRCDKGAQCRCNAM